VLAVVQVPVRVLEVVLARVPELVVRAQVLVERELVLVLPAVPRVLPVPVPRVLLAASEVLWAAWAPLGSRELRL
jgi:hypothetical protein